MACSPEVRKITEKRHVVMLGADELV